MLVQKRGALHGKRQLRVGSLFLAARYLVQSLSEAWGGGHSMTMTRAVGGRQDR